RGLVLVSGLPGTGKTLLAHILLEHLRTQAQAVLLLHIPESGHDLIASLCREFGVRGRASQTTGELVERLRTFLVDRYLEGKPVVAVIDEAQSMNEQTMEHLRMLGNLEKENAKLLQIVLLGQPEFLDRLAMPRMQQLCQRIFCHRQLKPLTRDQTRDYLRHRLKVAGANNPDLFTGDAIDLIHDRSAGLPRMINQIADNAMLAAYSAGRTTIDRDLVGGCIQDMLGPHLLYDASQAGPVFATPSTPGPAPADVSTSAVGAAHVVEGCSRELGESVRQGAEIVGRLAEVNHSARQNAEDLKTLLVLAEGTSTQLADTQQATCRARTELVGSIIEADRLTREIDRLALRLESGRSEAARLGERLAAIVDQAEQNADRLAGLGPEARRSMDESISKAEAAAADVLAAFRGLVPAATAAGELDGRLREAIDEGSRLRDVLQKTLIDVTCQSATAEDFLARLIEPTREAGRLVSEISCQTDRLDQAARHIPDLIAGCESRTGELVQRLAEARIQSQALAEHNQQAETLKATLAASAAELKAQTGKAENALCNSQDRIEELIRLTTRGAGLADWLEDAKQAAATACADCEKQMAALARQSEQLAERTAMLSGACDRADQFRQAIGTETRALESQLDRSQEAATRAQAQTQRLEDQLHRAESSAVELRTTHDQLQTTFSKEMVASLRQAGDALQAALSESVTSRDELLSASRDARLLATELSQSSDQAAQTGERLRTVTEQASAQAQRIEATVGESTRQADQLGGLITDAGHTAETLGKTRDEAARINNESGQRIAQLADQIAQGRPLSAELSRSADRATQVQDRLLVATEQASAQAQRIEATVGESTRQVDQLGGLIADAGRTAETLGKTRDEAALLDDEWTSRIRQLADENRQAARWLQELLDAGRKADIATEQFGHLTLAATERGTLVEEQIGQAEAARAGLDRLRIELTETLAPQARQELEQRKQQTITLFARMNEQCTSLSDATRAAMDTTASLGIATQRADRARSAAEEASRAAGERLARLQRQADQAAQAMRLEIANFSSSTEQSGGRLEKAAASADSMSRKLDEQGRRLGERVLETNQALGEMAARAEQQAEALVTQLSGAAALLEHFDNVRADVRDALGSQALRDLEATRAGLREVVEEATRHGKTLAEAIEAGTAQAEVLNESQQQADDRVRRMRAAIDQAGERLNALLTTGDAIDATRRQADRTVREAGELHDRLLSVLATGQREAEQLNVAESQARTRIDAIAAAVRQAEETTEHLANLRNETEQVKQDHTGALAALTARLDDAAKQSEQLNELLGESPRCREEISEQARIALHVKRDLEKAARRLAHERRMAEASIDRLHMLRMERINPSGGGSLFQPTATGGDEPVPANTCDRASVGILESIRRAVAAPEPPLGRPGHLKHDAWSEIAGTNLTGDSR
ncbi:MAG TPA: AAA family ATPase, partial [Phycisphaerae bacterium]|nr:AAA family ATPase [Phycisphaerae bacterium]